MVRSHVPNDSESEACPACRTAAARVHAIEALEDPFEVAGRDANAVILDNHERVVTFSSAAAADRSTFGRELHGVLQQVVDGGCQLAPIS